MATSSALDFFPTFLQLASINVPSSLVIDGKDMSSILLQGDDYGPWYSDYLFFWRESQVYAVRNGRYKVSAV
jgi:arylsulfatase A-like enzyme